MKFERILQFFMEKKLVRDIIYRRD